MTFQLRLRRGGSSRAVALLGALLGIVSGLLVAGAGPAEAHNILVRTSPVDGSTLARLPDVIVLTFNEPGQADGTVVAVTGPAGNVSSGSAMLIDSDVRQAVGPGSPAGRYTVDWRVVSADGHPVSGAFTFTATKGTSGSATPRPSAVSTTSSAANSTPHGAWWLIGGVIALVAIGVGTFILYRRRPAHVDDSDD